MYIQEKRDAFNSSYATKLLVYGIIYTIYIHSYMIIAT